MVKQSDLHGHSCAQEHAQDERPEPQRNWIVVGSPFARDGLDRRMNGGIGHSMAFPPSATLSLVNIRDPSVIDLGVFSPRRILAAASIASFPPVGY